MGGDGAPAIKRPHEAVDRTLQRRRVVAPMAGFAERLVDIRFECDNATDELAPLRLRVRHGRPGERQHAGKSTRDSGCQIGE